MATDDLDLLMAARDGHAETVKRLLKSGANINTVQADGLTALHIAAINNHVDVAKLLLNAGAKVDATDKIGNTPLHAAALNGKLAVAVVLIQSGANVNAVSGKHHATPLHLAAIKGSCEIVLLLLKSGAKADAILADGFTTPRAFAVNNGFTAIAELLKAAECKLEAEAARWRELGYFGGGDQCIRNALMVSGNCYVTEEAVDSIIRYVKEDWKGNLPQGFWLVKAEAYDKSSGIPYCLGHDGQFEIQWLEILADIEKEGRLPPCASRPFRLPARDFIGQTLIDIVHIKGLLSKD
jgi:ankyrin repeat protein